MSRVILKKRVWHLFVVALSTLLGCVQNPVSYTVPQGAGTKTIQITASSFGFEPNLITAQAGDSLQLQVNNSASLTHNLTLVDPEGNTLFSLDLPANQSRNQPIIVSQSGEYRFHCDKPLHSQMGMRGRILVEPQL